MSQAMTHHRVHEGSVQLADAADAERAVAVRHEAGALVRVPPQDLRSGVRHVIHRAAAHLQPEAHMGRLQQDHGRIRAGPHGLLDQPQVWHLCNRKASFISLWQQESWVSLGMPTRSAGSNPRYGAVQQDDSLYTQLAACSSSEHRTPFLDVPHGCASFA